MAFAVLLDLVLISLVTWFTSTQILVPLIRGSRLFPVFSKDTHVIADEIAAVDQAIETEHARHTLAQKQHELAHEKEWHYE